MPTPQETKHPATPNMIVILADDMGFSDIGCFGSEIRTPNLDRLANRGTRMTQFYNCARCCPTRASLLTGLYPHQTGVGYMIHDLGTPAYQGYLNDSCVTIAEALKANSDYTTLYAGKWHASPGIPIVGNAITPGEPGNPYPMSRGFDRFYGTLAGCGNFFNPHGLMEQDRQITADDDDYYYTDAITKHACSMVKDATAASSPFFLHVCYTAPHWPLHARPEDIERYRGNYRKGWDVLRCNRHEECKGLGILNPKWDISPRDSQSRPFEDDPATKQEWEDLCMAVYAAQIECMDRGIGQLLATLRDEGIEDDTLVMFLSDNGGCAEFLKEDSNDATWPGYYSNTARPGQTCTVGNNPSVEPGPTTTFMSYDLPWANVSNSPFRLFKHWVHEGGISTPFIASWPNGNLNTGALQHSPAHVVDIMATCLDAAGVAYPKEYNSHPVTPLEGESLLPALRGTTWLRECSLLWEHEGNRAIRDGQWKAVSKFPGAWELYNMEDDRTELNDLARKNASRLDALTRQYNDGATRTGIIPWEQLRH